MLISGDGFSWSPRTDLGGYARSSQEKWSGADSFALWLIFGIEFSVLVSDRENLLGRTPVSLDPLRQKSLLLVILGIAMHARAEM